MARFKLKSFVPKEYDEQCTVLAWCKLRESQYEPLRFIFATLNGVRLPIGLAVKMKKAGLKQGPPDLCLPYPMYDPSNGGHYCGWWGEMKRRDGGHLTDEQKAWHDHLRAVGYKVDVPAGASEAIACIARYLGIPI